MFKQSMIEGGRTFPERNWISCTESDSSGDSFGSRVMTCVAPTRSVQVEEMCSVGTTTEEGEEETGKVRSDRTINVLQQNLNCMLLLQLRFTLNTKKTFELSSHQCNIVILLSCRVHVYELLRQIFLDLKKLLSILECLAHGLDLQSSSLKYEEGYKVSPLSMKERAKALLTPSEIGRQSHRPRHSGVRVSQHLHASSSIEQRECADALPPSSHHEYIVNRDTCYHCGASPLHLTSSPDKFFCGQLAGTPTAGGEGRGNTEDNGLPTLGELDRGYGTDSAVCEVGETRIGEAVANGNHATAALQRNRGAEKGGGRAWARQTRLTETLEESVRVRERLRFGEKKRSCEGLSEEITEVSQDSSETAAEEEVTNLCLMADNLDHSDQEEEYEILRKDYALIDNTHMKLLDEFDELKKKCDELEKLNNEMERDGKTLIDENIHREHLLNIEIMGTEGDRLHTLIQDSDISWSSVNKTLRGNKDKYHQPRVYTLHQNARIIQHVLRSCIIPKAGDRVNMTPLLSLVTHLIMSDKPFDEAKLILDYIRSLTDIRHPQTKRKKNIALGHLICYILEKKYNLIYPEPPTEEPIFFTNASFRSLFHDPPAKGEDLEGEREAPLEPALAPNQNAYQDMIQRFDTMEANFGKRFDQIELHMKTQEDRHNLDMTWIRNQTDYIN
ncbi:hypothetical protein M5K25_004607 [Dendrobium thyrsiflorum]|uniref:Uncharacterized protein n=1 Tax=Dendrobium thyrsiflorum TaxID=117978 RepID=A0ABD0VGH3_DENTH